MDTEYLQIVTEWQQSVPESLSQKRKSFFKGFSAVSDWFAQPPPQPWLNSRGRHATLSLTCLAASPAHLLMTRRFLSGTPFDEVGAPFEGATFEGSLYISIYIYIYLGSLYTPSYSVFFKGPTRLCKLSRH
ncbi:unnamed protein product [Camellia sinensis]